MEQNDVTPNEDVNDDPSTEEDVSSLDAPGASAESGGSQSADAEPKMNVFSKLYHGETSFRFLAKRNIFFAISLIVIVAGLISLGVRGLRFGIDFKGGTSWEVPSKTLSVAATQSVLKANGISQATVVSLGGSGGRTIQAEADLSSLSVNARTTKEYTVAKALAKAGGVPSNAVGISDVGPTWGSQITTKALEALVFFFLGIVLYISIRFEWKMAAAAIIAVVHDLLVTVGIYSLANFQVTPDTVIAVLTILGYSLYDTIVVFDRVQENTNALVKTGRMGYADSVNLSLNQVLMRSLNTSIVAVIPVLSILVVGAYILGATTLQDFGLALFVGLTTGAYSSIGIATPLLAIFKEREPKYRALALRIAESGGPSILTPRAAAQASVGGFAFSGQGGDGGANQPPARKRPVQKKKPSSQRRSSGSRR